MKKYIFTESQIKKIIDSQINEQAGTFEFDEKQAINSGSEEFLNSKGIKGRDLTEKIKIYQRSIGCEQTGHMLDCIEVMRKKVPNDFKSLKNSIQRNKPIMDRFGSWVAGLFGANNPNSIY